ncbi:hypothetical protein [Vibrio lentus]|uniref:hypothetical protein n=1 Tax=Vibrio lentus TaxID=136468 RepID=UPI00178CA856|nr:hypothetical protein [Vibrio lentus]MDN3628614.1 hypothetical protein [Vibrio lentus]
MYIIDRDFTNNYLKVLNQFSKHILAQSSELPRSEEDNLHQFFSKLQSTLSSAIRNKKAWIGNIPISPNIIFQYKNPKGGNRKYFISIGGVIKIENRTIIEQCLCVNLMIKHTESCDDIPEEWNSYPLENGYHVLRRFHFDFDTNNDDRTRPKFHLQYGGNFEPEYLNIDDDVHYKLFSPIDHPRLPQQPYDIIMLLDYVLREFELGGLSVINDSGWKKHIIDSENIWLKPYYDAILTRLTNTSRSNTLHRLE